MAGFEWKYNLSGGRPLIHTLVAKDTETLTKGDLLNLESGEVDLAATADTAIIGALQGAEDPDKEVNSSGVKTPGVVYCTDSTTVLKVIVNPDAVYATADANARNVGATLDISGATGAQTVATSSNTEFTVVERKRTTSEDTRVIIMHALHPFNA